MFSAAPTAKLSASKFLKICSGCHDISEANAERLWNGGASIVRRFVTIGSAVSFLKKLKKCGFFCFFLVPIVFCTDFFAYF